MNEKKYLHVNVTTHNGIEFFNPLKLSEAYLVSQLAQQNKSLKVRLVTTTAAEYKSIFG